MRPRRLARSTLLAVALALPIAGTALAAPGPVRRGGADAAQCTANVVHPVSVRVVALDPIVRGTDLRLQVTSSARVPVEKASARLVSTGGVLLQSPASVALGSLVPGRTA